MAAVLATAAIVGLSLLAASFLPGPLGLDGAAPPVGGPPPDPVTGVPGREIPPSSLWTLAIFQVVAVALTLLAGVASKGRLRDILALRPAAQGWRAYLGAIVAMAVLQLALAAVQFTLLGHDMLTDLRPFVGLVRGPGLALAAAVMAVGAPLSEELLFRGFLLGALAQSRLGFWGAALVSTLLWSALHWGYSLAGLAEVFCIGMLLCWLLRRTGSLRVTIFCHTLYNALIVLALRVVELPA
jgi:membrane protease YdiL (CAAX protease family)